MSTATLAGTSDDHQSIDADAEHLVEIDIGPRRRKRISNDKTTTPAHSQSPWNITVILTGVTVCASALFIGYDLGMINVAMVFATENPDLGITTLWQGAIVSAVPGFAGVGALIAAPLSDKLGRKRVINLSTAIYTLGSLVASISTGRYMLLVARVITGLFMGLASVLVPIYLSECSPSSIRGRMTSMFQISVNTGTIIANLVSAAVSGMDTANISWRLLSLFPCFATAFQMVGFTFLPESPNWVYGHVGKEETIKILKGIYNNDETSVSAAFDGIVAEQEQVNEIQGYSKIFTTDYVFKALVLGTIIQWLNAASGIVTIQSFIGTTIKSIGVTDQLSIIWFSLTVAVVLLIFSMIPLFAVDRYGRRPVLLFSQITSGIALLAITAAFYQASHTTGAVVPQASTDLFVVNCQQYTSCSSCIQDAQCGFCGPSNQYSSAAGYCLPPSGNATCEGPIVDLHWSFYESFCPTAWSWVPLVCILIFLAVFSAGFSSLPWTLNAEFYPLWARSKCAAIAATALFWSNLIFSLTFLSAVEAITVYGTYLVFAVITLLGALFCYHALPETKNRSIEEIQHLFMSKKSVRQNNAMNLSEIPSSNRAGKKL